MAEEDRPSFLRLRSQHRLAPHPTRPTAPRPTGSPWVEGRGPSHQGHPRPPPPRRDVPLGVPPEVLELYRSVIGRGQTVREAWGEALGGAGPVIVEAFDAALTGRGPPGWDAGLPGVGPGRQARDPPSQRQRASPTPSPDRAPGLNGRRRRPDLGNTGTKLDGLGRPIGRRAWAVASCTSGCGSTPWVPSANGAAMHGGGAFAGRGDVLRVQRLHALCAVRLRPPSRQAKVVFSWTHDSVGLGPMASTHQPIEQLAAMRAMPGLQSSVRPTPTRSAGARRIAVATATAQRRSFLTRQPVPVLDGTADAIDGVARGAYVLGHVAQPALVLIGTGSEVVGVPSRPPPTWPTTASPPGWCRCRSWELFAEQTADYRAEVLPAGVLEAPGRRGRPRPSGGSASPMPV